MAGEVIGMEARNDLMGITSRYFLRPVDTADMEPISFTGMNPYGINVFLNQEVEERKIRQSLEIIRDGGFGWVKMQLLWADVERPAKGRYSDDKLPGISSWTKYDRVVSLCREYGLQLILRIDTSPSWARPGRSKIETPPDDLNDYGDFVYTTVKRYQGKVQYYQIWNEPNVKFEWGDQVPDAEAFTEMLRVAYQRAKEADPEVVIIAPALAPTIEVSPRAVSDLVFLQTMYDHGAKAYFDIASTNPYGLRSGPDDHRLDPDEDVNFSRPILLRELMVRNGDAAKPIWAAELGWNALPLDYEEEPLFGRVSRYLQAIYTARAYQRAQEEWPWMGVMNLWHFRMIHEADKQQQQYYFGITDDQFRPYPVYDALKAQSTQSRVMRRGYHQESHWALTYEGDWTEQKDSRASLGKYMVAGPGRSSLRFSSVGTNIDIVTRRGPGDGRMIVYLDGVSSVPSGDVRPLTSLSNPFEEWQYRVPIARQLAPGTHSIEIITEGPVVLDGLLVDNQPMFPWPAAWLAGAAIIGMLAIRKHLSPIEAKP
jgi:hypothetical protein